MSDITMCANICCPSHLKCYRFTATPSDRMQSYMAFTVPNGKKKCEKFMKDSRIKRKKSKLTVIKALYKYRLLCDQPYNFSIGRKGDVVLCLNVDEGHSDTMVTFRVLGPNANDRTIFFDQVSPMREILPFVEQVRHNAKVTQPKQL